MTVADFIKELGGTVAVATALDVAPTTVSSWKSSGSIPRWRIAGIKALARKRKVDLPEFISVRQDRAA